MPRGPVLRADLLDADAPRRAEIAAVNGHGTARSVAGLYVALTQDRLLSPSLLAETTRVHAVGHDQVLGQDASWGLGFGVDGRRTRPAAADLSPGSSRPPRAAPRTPRRGS